MNVNEQLAVLTALKKAVDERLKEVRSGADEAMRDAYEEDGVEKKALKVCGEKVGELVVTFASDGYEASDRKAFEEFAVDYGLASVKRSIRPDMMDSCIKALESVFDAEVLEEAVRETVVVSADWEKSMSRVGDAVCYMDSGMVVPGVEYRPKLAKGTMVRGCKPDDVVPILRGLPGGVDALLLGGSDHGE